LNVMSGEVKEQHQHQSLKDKEKGVYHQRQEQDCRVRQAEVP